MHILYLHQSFSDPQRGFETRSYEFGRRLVRDGHQVTIITGNKRLKMPLGRDFVRETELEGMRVFVLNDTNSVSYESKTSKKSFFSYAGRAIKIGLKINRPHAILATSTPLAVAMPGIILSKRYRVPMVFEVRSLWPEAPIQMGDMKNRLAILAARFLERYAYRKAERIITLSPGIMTGILEQGADADKLAFVPNASDNDFFLPGPTDDEFLRMYGLENRFLAVFTGSVEPSSGLKVLLGAAKLLENNPQVTWVIAGEGKDLKEMQRQVVKNGLEDSVRFLGHLSKYDLACLLKCAGCVTVLFQDIPALHSSSPSMLFEALAAGKPIVSNMPGWVEGLLRDYNAGLTVKPGDSFELARAVETLHDRPELVKLMSRKARLLAEERFDRETLYRQFADVLIDVSGEEVHDV